VGSMFWRRWAQKNLIAGDLASLLDLTRDGRWNDPNPNRLRRLRRRGFIKEHEGDQLRVTMK
jgi:hypothetical protein